MSACQGKSNARNVDDHEATKSEFWMGARAQLPTDDAWRRRRVNGEFVPLFSLRAASHEFIRAAASYQDAADTYRQVASMIIQVASSERFLNALCKRPTSVDIYRSFLGAYGVQLDDKGSEQRISRMLGKQSIESTAPNKTIIELPLPAMNALVKRAAQMLLCGE